MSTNQTTVNAANVKRRFSQLMNSMIQAQENIRDLQAELTTLLTSIEPATAATPHPAAQIVKPATTTPTTTKPAAQIVKPATATTTGGAAKA